MDGHKLGYWTINWDEGSRNEIRVWKGSEDLGYFAKYTLEDLHFLISEVLSGDCQCGCYESGYLKAQETVGEWNRPLGH